MNVRRKGDGRVTARTRCDWNRYDADSLTTEQDDFDEWHHSDMDNQSS